MSALNAGANHPLEMFVLFLPAAIVELLFGAGPTEPSLWQKLLMPYREPKDTQIAPR